MWDVVCSIWRDFVYTVSTVIQLFLKGPMHLTTLTMAMMNYTLQRKSIIKWECKWVE